MSVFGRMLDGPSGCEELLASIFGLNELETTTYFRLVEDPGMRVERLAEVLDRDRSTAHRAVQALVEAELVRRETRPLEGGGYCYVYHPVDPDHVAARIEARLRAFEDAVQEMVDRFEATTSKLAPPAGDVGPTVSPSSTVSRPNRGNA